MHQSFYKRKETFVKTVGKFLPVPAGNVLVTAIDKEYLVNFRVVSCAFIYSFYRWFKGFQIFYSCRQIHNICVTYQEKIWWTQTDVLLENFVDEMMTSLSSLSHLLTNNNRLNTEDFQWMVESCRTDTNYGKPRRSHQPVIRSFVQKYKKLYNKISVVRYIELYMDKGRFAAQMKIHTHTHMYVCVRERTRMYMYVFFILTNSEEHFKILGTASLLLQSFLKRGSSTILTTSISDDVSFLLRGL